MAIREATVRLVLDDERIAQAIGAVLDAAEVDVHCRLVGDEDCGVGIECRTCDLGGQPIAYHPGLDVNPYPEAEVPTATGIFHLYLLANKHVRDHHAAGAEGL